MTCAGSMFLQSPRAPAGQPALDGTAAGELLRFKVHQQPAPAQASNGVYFDNDMDFFTAETAKKIPAHANSEVHVPWTTRSGIIIDGRYDFAFEHEGILYIDDFKYGFGIVEVFENWQLLAYAIGEVIRLNKYFPKIRMRIHQPRPHHEGGPTRTWEITYEELNEYKERIEVRMAQLASGFSELVVSEKCKYCSHAAETCPAFNRAFFSAVDVTLNQAVQDGITEAELSKQLDLMDQITNIFKIKKDSIEELAKMRIRSGKVIPGWISEDSYGHRKWNPGVSPASVKAICGADITEVVTMSPAQAEKKARAPKDLIEKLASAPFAGQKLVRKDAVKAAPKDLFKQPNGG